MKWMGRLLRVGRVTSAIAALASGLAIFTGGFFTGGFSTAATSADAAFSAFAAFAI
jgi:hypothetical protein